MRIRNPLLVALLLTVGLVLGVTKVTSAKRIEAIHGKEYRLSKRHGPWMIMVATFKELPPEMRTKGMTPAEAADELVYALRKRGVPAYTYGRKEVNETIDTTDRLGRKRTRHFTAQQQGIAVLAGNYRDPDDRIAQRTLSRVKKLHPKFLQDVEKSSGFVQKLKNGGLYRKTPGRKGPLGGAFLTVNPMLSPEEAHVKKQGPLLLKLNSGMEYSLLENQGKYSLRVASFHGKSATHVPNTKFGNVEKDFKVTSALDDAAFEAWELAKYLRSRNVEAYVFHDRYSSIVTVGAFESSNDPRIPEMAKSYAAKRKTDPNTNQEILAAEMVTIPPNPRPNEMIEKRWIFDPEPKLLKVPQL